MPHGNPKALQQQTKALQPGAPPKATHSKHRKLPLTQIRWLADLTGGLRIDCTSVPALESDAIRSRRYNGGRAEPITRFGDFGDVRQPDRGEEGMEGMEGMEHGATSERRRRPAAANAWWESDEDKDHAPPPPPPPPPPFHATLLSHALSVPGLQSDDGHDDVLIGAAWMLEDWKPGLTMPDG